MASLNAIVAVLTVAGMMAIAWGYRASLRHRGTATWYFAMGVAVLAGSMGLRRIYWDVVWTMARRHTPETAFWWSDITGATNINIVFNSLVLASIYCSLKARQLLLPEDEQARWPWWRAWAHPSLLWWK